MANTSFHSIPLKDLVDDLLREENLNAIVTNASIECNISDGVRLTLECVVSNNTEDSLTNEDAYEYAMKALGF